MTCPVCKERLYCYNTYSRESDTARKYKCPKCGKKYYTYEHIESPTRVCDLFCEKEHKRNRVK